MKKQIDFKREFALRQKFGFRPKNTALTGMDRLIHDVDISEGTTAEELSQLSERFYRTFN